VTQPTAPDSPTPALSSPAPEATFDLQQLFTGDWLQSLVQDAGKQLQRLTRDSLGGFLGVVGFLLSLVIVPIYLFYFLIEAPSIATSWSDYLPLRASAFKDEVVSVLNEINGYLIAFFRGQLVVSMINGAVTGIGLAFVRLEFGLLIGVVLCFLGIVPYLGITACWVISLGLAVIQGESWLVPHHPLWLFPFVISCIFFVVHWFDGLFVTPKIVGDSVGLHPFTVIFSIFVWSLLMGGLLGAILAVPLTATVKVLLRRYVWERNFRSPTGQVLPRELTIPISATTPSHEPIAAR
jgi:predicted PurR-regulated permease PerM